MPRECSQHKLLLGQQLGSEEQRNAEYAGAGMEVIPGNAYHFTD
jgi:hypothetical protein